MSFNDLAVIYDRLENIPIDRLNSTDVVIIIAIARMPNGFYKGLSCLAMHTRTSEGNLKKRLRHLRNLGIVEREQTYARKGLRQRYSINITAIDALTERVSVETPLAIEEVRKDVKSVIKDSLGIFEVAKGSSSGYPYKEYKEYKNDKDERFLLIISGLSEEIKELIDYAPNISETIDKLVSKGWTLEAIKSALEEVDFSNSYSVGGLFVDVLEKLLSRLAPKENQIVRPFEEYDCTYCTEIRGCVMGAPSIPCTIYSKSVERIAKDRNGL